MGRPAGFIKKNKVKWCPICGERANPDMEQHSVCSNDDCKFRFAVFQPSERDMVKIGSKTYMEECGNGIDGKRGKVCHSSVAEAYARCMDVEDIPNRYRDIMQFYECRFCHKIHMGHGGKKRKNVTVFYTHEEAKALYEQALERGEIEPYEINQNQLLQNSELSVL